jgi:hypothetical protein
MDKRNPEYQSDATQSTKDHFDSDKGTTSGKLVYTKVEAAGMLSVNVSSINWLLRKGVLPHRKIAGKIRFAETDLRTYLDRVKVDAAVIPCCAADEKGGRL